MFSLPLSFPKPRPSKKRKKTFLPPSFPQRQLSLPLSPVSTQCPSDSNPVLPERSSWASGSWWTRTPKELSGSQEGVRATPLCQALSPLPLLETRDTLNPHTPHTHTLGNENLILKLVHLLLFYFVLTEILEVFELQIWLTFYS